MTDVAAAGGIEMGSASWQFVPGGEAPAEVTVPYAVIGEEPDGLLLTGLGERDVAAIAERLAANGVNRTAVANLVHPSVPRRLIAVAAEQAIIKGTEALVDEITAEGHALQQLAGNSQGANQAMLAAGANPDLYGQVVAIAPLVNGEALGDNPKDQARTLFGRFKEAELSIVDSGGFDRELLQELMGGLACFGEQDAAAILAALDGRLKIHAGEKDLVVPPDETEAVAGAGRMTRWADIGHPTLNDETGAAQVALIMRSEWTAGIVK